MAQWVEALLDELSSNLRTHGKVKGENRLHKFYPDLHSHVHTCTHTCEHTLTMVVVVNKQNEMKNQGKKITVSKKK